MKKEKKGKENDSNVEIALTIFAFNKMWHE